ncbi:Proteasome subunit beta type-5 protein [Ceratobasidium theobromae]|uniref:proteasome endopeptidase complex n=1 Tax=Ceratobasidium theobromae TaxID=1582974 RepID=A0A5N5QVM7_9AGAM|nr:Proteasome subunit beta type-5 protein [Ceratobasidium theobromae]
MNSIVSRYASTSAIVRKDIEGDNEEEIGPSMWGSTAGFAIGPSSVPTFNLPRVPDLNSFLRLHTDDRADPNCRIKIQHGTTTLAFRFQGGIIVSVDSRATAGSYIATPTVKKVIEINKYLLGTMAGGAGLPQLIVNIGKPISAFYAGCTSFEIGNGTMIAGWDKTGPALFYVDDDGTRLKGDIFSVGSGSMYAYGVLDQGYRWDLTDEEAQELGRRSIYAAGHRDAMSGNSCNLYHIKEDGWKFIGNYDISTLHYEGPGEVPGAPGGGYGYDVRVGTVPTA